VRALRATLRGGGALPARYAKGTYAAHVVAAAVVEAAAGAGSVTRRAEGEGVGGIPRLMTRMRKALKTMHDRNPSWGPLYVAQPGDVVMRRAWDEERPPLQR